MWKNKKSFGQEDDEDSWEVRAFEEDISGNLLGYTWPPRSYTCVFCLREFRSAQALGGHMNVHRQDRAKLHEVLPMLRPPPPTLPQATKGREESAAGNGIEMSLLQPFSNTNSFFNHSHQIGFSPSFSISPYLMANVVEPSDPRTEYATTGEVDLELRLGQSWPPI